MSKPFEGTVLFSSKDLFRLGWAIIKLSLGKGNGIEISIPSVLKLKLARKNEQNHH